MAWTAPRTWVVGEIVTAALMNTHVRDNTRYVKGLDGVPTIESGLIIDNTGGDEYLQIPSLTTTERNNLTPVNGMVVYNETTNEFNKYENAGWKDLGGGTDHGGLDGLTDDDHTQYQKENVLTTAGDIAYATAASTWARLGIGTANQLLRTNTGATAPEWTTVGIPPTIVRKSAEEIVNNSAVMQNDDELLLAVGASEVWEFELYIRHTSATTTPDIDILFAVPAASSLLKIPNYNTAHQEVADADITLASSSANNGYWAKYLYIGGANAGNIQLTWAQNVATAEDTKVLANSFIIAHKLA